MLRCSGWCNKGYRYLVNYNPVSKRRTMTQTHAVLILHGHTQHLATEHWLNTLLFSVLLDRGEYLESMLNAHFCILHYTTHLINILPCSFLSLSCPLSVQLQLAPIRTALLFLSISLPRMHQFQKSLCPSPRGGPEDSKTPPTCKVWMILSQAMAFWTKRCFEIIKDLLVFGTKLSIKIIFRNFNFL